MGGNSKGSRAGAREQSEGDSVATGDKLSRPGQLKAALESGVIDLAEFADRCREGMNATKAVTSEGEMWHVEDWPTRLAFLRFITETVEGMPVKRQEIVSRKIPTTEDLESLIARSPAFAREVRRLLDRVDAERASGPAKGDVAAAIEAGELDGSEA